MNDVSLWWVVDRAGRVGLVIAESADGREVLVQLTGSARERWWVSDLVSMID